MMALTSWLNAPKIVVVTMSENMASVIISLMRECF